VVVVDDALVVVLDVDFLVVVDEDFVVVLVFVFLVVVDEDVFTVLDEDLVVAGEMLVDCVVVTEQ